MLDVIALPAFNDNYIWLIRSRGDARCWVVDPGDAEPVRRYLQQHRLQLEGILLTHHHKDHIGGVPSLWQPGITLVGSVQDVYRLPALTLQVSQGDRFQMLGHTLQVLEVPGHTLGHIAYFIEDQQPPLLFCGDTLFAGGCGRLFEGTREQMHASLQSLARLPASTRVYAAHEYTLSNLKFALQVEPDNTALQQRLEACETLREQQQPTLPSDLATELATNPFLRIDQPGVRQSIRTRFPDQPSQESAEIFGLLRHWKDIT